MLTKKSKYVLCIVWVLIATIFLNTFVTKVSAFNDANILVTPVELDFSLNHGDSVDSQVLLRTGSVDTVTLYPVELDWDVSDNSFSVPSSGWVTFESSTAEVSFTSENTFSFSITVPAQTVTGEYYKFIGFASEPFSLSSSSDPPVIAAVFATITVDGVIPTPTPTPSPQPGPSTTPSPAPASSASPVAQSSATPVASVTPRVTFPITIKPLPPEEGRAALFSSLDLTNFSSHLDMFNWSQVFNFTLENKGNISVVPVGHLAIKNSKGQVVKLLKFNEKKSNVYPDVKKKFELFFKPEAVTLGRFNAEIWVGYEDHQVVVEPLKVTEIGFFYISPILVVPPIIAVLLLYLVHRFTKNYLGYKKYSVRFLSFVLFFWSMYPLMSHFYALRMNNDQVLSEDEVTVSATILETTGIDVTSDVITIKSNANKGWNVYSLSANPATLLLSVPTNQVGDRGVSLSGSQDQYPVLVVIDFDD